MKRITIKQVNAALRAKWPNLTGLELVKGNGYYYLYSSDNKVGLQLAGLYSTSMDVATLNHISIAEWVEYAELILTDWQRYPSERMPLI